MDPLWNPQPVKADKRICNMVTGFQTENQSRSCIEMCAVITNNDAIYYAGASASSDKHNVTDWRPSVVGLSVRSIFLSNPYRARGTY